jgi:hypothetical protein
LENLILGKTFPNAIDVRTTTTPNLIAIEILDASAVVKATSRNSAKNQKTPLLPVLYATKLTLLNKRVVSNIKFYSGQESPNSRTILKPTTINTQAILLQPAM